MGKILSIALSVLGIVVFLFGNNMSGEAAQGEARISQAEESEGGRRPILGPVRRGARNQAAMSNQEQLGQEGQTVMASLVTGNWLRGIGVVLFAVGIGSLVFCRKRN